MSWHTIALTAWWCAGVGRVWDSGSLGGSCRRHRESWSSVGWVSWWRPCDRSAGGFQLSKTKLSSLDSVSYICLLTMARDGERIQVQHFCHHGDIICHPNSIYIYSKTVRNVYKWMQQEHNVSQKCYFHVSYRRRMPGSLTWQRSGLGDACQSGKMAPLLNSLFFVFKSLLLLL